MYPLLEYSESDLEKGKRYSKEVLSRCQVAWVGWGFLMQSKGEPKGGVVAVIQHGTQKGKTLYHLLGKADDSNFWMGQTVDESLCREILTTPAPDVTGGAVSFKALMANMADTGIDTPSRAILIEGPIASFLDMKVDCPRTGRSIPLRDRIIDLLTEDVKPETDAADKINPMELFIRRYWFKKPVMLEGGKGLGKTYTVVQAAMKSGYEPIVLQGHAGIEAIDMLGHYVQAPGEDGQIQSVWVDGKLTAAFRMAANGKKVVLLIDEILRIPARELDLLTSPLAPVNDHYTLVTGRPLGTIDGVAQIETISAPVENLAVIATTNIGHGYNVEETDKALSDRFRRKWFNTDLSTMYQVLLSKVQESGFDEEIADNLLGFFSAMQKLALAHEIEEPANLRHLCEAVDLADDQDDVRDELINTIPQWVGRTFDGEPDPAQVEAVMSCIDVYVAKIPF